MKKDKLINIFNYIVLFSGIYGISAIFWAFFRTFSGLEPTSFILMIPIEFLGKWLNIFLQLFFDKIYIDIFLIPGVLLLMGIADLFLITEKSKYSDCFFPNFSERTKRWIIRITVFLLIASIFFAYVFFMGAIF